MSDLKIYEVAAVYYPTEEDKKMGMKEAICLYPKAILATCEQNAILQAGQLMESNYDMQNVKVFARLF